MMRIHFIAIGGSIMHSLAIQMSSKGHAVSGSDDEIYEPSRSRLANYGLLPAREGWHPEALSPDIDLVVLGMHARRDNPELARAHDLGLKIQSFPEFVYHLSEDKMRVVVAGSHGKTTTSGMIAHVLHQAGIPADRMIGASIGSLEPVAISDAGIIILEGDEYLSSPEDPRPKFVHYHPQITVITGIAWDHMNVFPTYQSYIDTFRQLILSLRGDDILIYCQDDPDLEKLVKEESPLCILIPYSIHPYQSNDGQVSLIDEANQKHPVRIFGLHNMQNLAAARLVLHRLGVSDDQFYRAISTFEGAAKRLQLIHHSDGQVISYLDFAHAPSKVKATVHAVRERHHDALIIAILELHTFSSLNSGFLPLYAQSLKEADIKIVYYSPHTLFIKQLPDLSPELLNSFFGEEDLQVVTSVEALDQLMKKTEMKAPVVLLWMSSGRFDGYDISRISQHLDQRFH
jgi:UDP-N-acetylmuramate: L-alanyl-gamma-D-glutamyl-meso-diaminopimelate ligase